MDYCKTIFHVVQPGDSLYRLAQRYQTTVPDIIMRNPGINAYNLQVGSRLRICPGFESGEMRPEQRELNNDMRQAWSQHNFWGNMFLVSLFHTLENLDAVKMRLEQSPEDIAAVFQSFYANPTVTQIRNLLAEHVRLAGEMANAMKNGNMERSTQLETQLNQNADQMARLLANANSNYDYDELRRMMRNHLNLMQDTMTSELSGDHNEAVRLMGENEDQLMDMADVLTEGLVQQFYR